MISQYLMTIDHAKLADRLGMRCLFYAIRETIYRESTTPIGGGSDMSVRDYKRKCEYSA